MSNLIFIWLFDWYTSYIIKRKDDIKMAIKYSALNLVPIREGDDEQTAINDMVNLAQHLDELSYERY